MRRRIVFMGSPDEVVAPLRQLFDASEEGLIELIGVVTQPPRPSGRGALLADPPVAIFAKAHNLLCLQPESAKAPEFLEVFKKLEPDIVVTAAYGQILSEAFLAIPRIGTINIHPSKLPLYRGATPVAAALLDGLTSTSVTILFTVKKLDAGPIILQENFAIGAHENAGQLTARLFEESGAMLLKVIKILSEDPTFAGTPQDDSVATFCKKITKNQGQVDWGLPSFKILNQFRAFEPWPGSWTVLGDRRIAIVSMDVDGLDLKNKAEGEFEFDKSAKAIVVGCGAGRVLIRRLKPSGGKEMDAASFWNGLKDKTLLKFQQVQV